MNRTAVTSIDASLDRPFLGILLMLGFCVMAPVGDAIAKHLGDAVPLAILILTRFAVQAVVLVPLALSHRLRLWAGGRHFWLTMLRSLLHILGIGLMFSGLRYLPLADAIAIAFVMPFIMLLLGRFVLGETVGTHRLAACAVGFVGTLLVVQPNLVEVGLPALLPLGVALVFALFMLVTRVVARTVAPIALQAVSGVQATAIMLLAIAFWPDAWPGAPDFALFGAPDAPLLWLAALGIVGTVAHLLMTGSLRFAPSATLAPMQYLEIPIGTLIGWIAFRDLPNGLAAVGIAVTMAAGLYVIARERRAGIGAGPRASAMPPARKAR